MVRRHYQRHLIELPVTVSGIDTHGHPFTQSATTVEISAHGLKLRGISCLRAPGDPVQIKYKHRTADYHVAWLGEFGTSLHGMVGLEGEEDARHLFADIELDFRPRLDTYQVPSDAAPEPAALVAQPAPRTGQPERRRHPRYNCAGAASAWEKDQCGVSGRLNEISRCGCYIEMMSPMRVGTVIGLELVLGGRTIRLQGIVRTSHPNIGMGVEFTHIAPPEAEKLCQLVAVLAGELPDPPLEAPAPQALPAMSEAEIGEAVLQWFGAHEVLSRQKLLELLQRSERNAEMLAGK
jgi:hypothetical protein